MRTPVGEIDIVARRGRTLVFIEVKLRDCLSAALEAVHRRNRDRVTRAALYYLAQRPSEFSGPCRFDVVALAPPFSMRHIKGAWETF